MNIENGALFEVFNKDIVDGKFIIPDSVVKICDWAFANCYNLESITISDSVNEIRGEAFYKCKNLIKINVNKNNKYYSSKDGVLFNKGAAKLIQFPQGKRKKKYIIPNSVTVIEDFAFWDCKKLESIIIPDSVTEIGKFAFYNCNRPVSVIIPDSITKIERYAFANCKQLESIIIPDLVTEIGYNAFENCKTLRTKKDNYKAFLKGLICIDMQYKPNEWNTIEGDIKLCEWGLHYATNLFDIFNYYSGNLEEDIEIWEVEVGDAIVNNSADSKKATNSIKPIKRLTREEIISILNNR